MAIWEIIRIGGWIPIGILFIVAIGINFFWLWVQKNQRKFMAEQKYVVLAVDVPKYNEQGPEVMEKFFANLLSTKMGGDWIEKYVHGVKQLTLSFEMVSIAGGIQFLVRIPVQFREMIESAFYSNYPEVELYEVGDYVQQIPECTFEENTEEQYDLWGADIILSKENAYPITTYRQFEHQLSKQLKDPLGGTLEAMGKLGEGEQLWFQTIVVPAGDDWIKKSDDLTKDLLGMKKSDSRTFIDVIHEKIVNGVERFGDFFTGDVLSVSDEEKGEKKELLQRDKKMIEAVQEKASKIGFTVKIRLIYLAKKEMFNKGRVLVFLAALNQFNMLGMNGFQTDSIMKTSIGRFGKKKKLAQKKRDLFAAYKNRSTGWDARPYILNVEELATLYHFPTIDIKAPLVQKTTSRRAEPPINLPTE